MAQQVTWQHWRWELLDRKLALLSLIQWPAEEAGGHTEYVVDRQLSVHSARGGGTGPRQCDTHHDSSTQNVDVKHANEWSRAGICMVPINGPFPHKGGWHMHDALTCGPFPRGDAPRRG